MRKKCKKLTKAGVYTDGHLFKLLTCVRITDDSSDTQYNS